MQEPDSRILIAGSYGQGNTGDEAILAAIIDQLRTRIPDARLVVVAGDTESIRRQYGVETIWWADWASIAQAVEQCDMVIQGGGGIFFDYSGFHPWSLFENRASDLAHYGGYSLLANLYRKPFMIYSVGVGPLLSDSARKMVKVAHLLADKITVRDGESKSTLTELGIEPNRIEVTADPAFCLRPANEARAREIFSELGIDSGRPVIAITLRPWDVGVSQLEWERSLAGAISAFAKSKKPQILLIPFHKGYDDGPLLRLRELLPDLETFFLQSRCMPHEIAGVIGACDFLIGMRLHSLLFAILTGTPAVSLAYDPKVRNLTRLVGHEEICVDLTDLSNLKDVIENSWRSRKQLSSDFAKARSSLTVLSERNADLACDLLDSGIHNASSDSEVSDMFAKAFYGRLQAVRVRDCAISKQDELRRSAGINEEEASSSNRLAVSENDSTKTESLSEFVNIHVNESTEHLVVIYEGALSNGGSTGLAEALMDYGIPTICIRDKEPHAANCTKTDAGNCFVMSPTSVTASSDEVLYVSTPRSCRRVLILKAVDLTTFRLINHAHANNWVTVYWPDQSTQHERTDPDAHSYALKNAEYVVVGTESLKYDMQSIGAREPRIVSDNESANDQVKEILKLVRKAAPKSLVRLAIEGASHE